MHNKLKNTLTGLFVALGMIALSVAAGQEPRHIVATADASGTLITLDAAKAAPVRKQAPIRRAQVVMPYFSLAPLLPKQES
jgi:hypothetical protein